MDVITRMSKGYICCMEKIVVEYPGISYSVQHDSRADAASARPKPQVLVSPELEKSAGGGRDSVFSVEGRHC